VKDKHTKEYAAAERDRVVELAFERGVHSWDVTEHGAHLAVAGSY